MRATSLLALSCLVFTLKVFTYFLAIAPLSHFQNFMSTQVPYTKPQIL